MNARITSCVLEEFKKSSGLYFFSNSPFRPPRGLLKTLIAAALLTYLPVRFFKLLNCTAVFCTSHLILPPFILPPFVRIRWYSRGCWTHPLLLFYSSSSVFNLCLIGLQHLIVELSCPTRILEFSKILSHLQDYLSQKLNYHFCSENQFLSSVYQPLNLRTFKNS